MCGFAFQVDRLVAEIEDHQFLHELSLEDNIAAEKLPGELNLSANSSDSSMSGVAPLPPDPAQDDLVQESSVTRLPPDDLDCGVIEDIPVPSACSMPIHLSAPPAPGVSRAWATVCAVLQKSLEVLSNMSCSSESFVMEKEQPISVEADVLEQEEPDVVGPDSQMVKSVAPQDALTASLLVTTEAVIHSSPSGVTSPLPASSSGVLDLPRTPQLVPLSYLQEAASSDALGAAGRSEDPASTIQESVLEGSLPPSLDPTSAIPGVLSAQEGSNHTLVDGVMVSSKAAHPPSSIPSKSSDLKQESTDEGSEVGYSSGQEETDKCTHPVSPLVCADIPAPLPSSPSAPDHPASSSLLAQDQCLSTLPPPPPAEHLRDSPHRTPTRSSLSERRVDSLDVMGKLAPVDSHPPGSGQLSLELPNPSILAAKPESPPPPPFTSSTPPDCAEPSKDSFAQPQAEEECLEEVLSAECDADLSSALDITLESRAQVPMDRAVVEQLHAKAAKELALWEDCLSHMTVNEHPHCEYPHVYGVRCDMEYYVKMEIPEQMACSNEFHNRLL